MQAEVSTQAGTPAEDDAMADDASRGLRSSGMRDLGPDDMSRFRQVERAFLDCVGEAGFREVRTPTIEPLHLYTAAGTLSPQALDASTRSSTGTGGAASAWSCARTPPWPLPAGTASAAPTAPSASPTSSPSTASPRRRPRGLAVRRGALRRARTRGRCGAADSSPASSSPRSVSIDSRSSWRTRASSARSSPPPASTPSRSWQAYDRMLDGDTEPVSELAPTTRRAPPPASALRGGRHLRSATSATCVPRCFRSHPGCRRAMSTTSRPPRDRAR
jgi:hypothetical protein